MWCALHTTYGASTSRVVVPSTFRLACSCTNATTRSSFAATPLGTSNEAFSSVPPVGACRQRTDLQGDGDGSGGVRASRDVDADRRVRTLRRLGDRLLHHSLAASDHLGAAVDDGLRRVRPGAERRVVALPLRRVRAREWIGPSDAVPVVDVERERHDASAAHGLRALQGGKDVVGGRAARAPLGGEELDEDRHRARIRLAGLRRVRIRHGRSLRIRLDAHSAHGCGRARDAGDAYDGEDEEPLVHRCFEDTPAVPSGFAGAGEWQGTLAF